MQSQKRQNDLYFQGKPFNITVIQAYAPTSNAEEAEVEWFYKELQDLLYPTPKKDVFFIPVPYNEKDIFFGVLVLESLVGLYRTIQLQLLWH